jgi:hypothetical protein
MAAELAPGAIAAVFARAAVLAQARTAAGLAATAAAVAHQAQVNASTGSHTYGTPTPAYPGTGPATISRTLVNSIAFSTPKAHGMGWTCRVGPRVGMYPAYAGRRGTTASSRYGYYLEHGLRNGATYPWLRPAGRIGSIAGVVAFRRVFSLPWV